MKNPLLCRRQAILDVVHPNLPMPSRKDLEDRIAKMYKADKEAVFCFGFRTAFGGGKSTGFILIYESVDAAKKFEPKHRLVRHNLATVTKSGRKQRKEKKNRMKKIRGTAKNKPATKK